MLAMAAKPCEAVFISDLHLNSSEPHIIARFNSFIEWAATHTHAVYILGDFFHAWPGDDDPQPWTEAIAERLLWLVSQQVHIYFMPGNRDFLLGERFAKASGLRLLTDPSIIELGKEKIVLAHGDVYCTQDKSHQWFRWFTRNALFTRFFLRLPLAWRRRLVQQVRQRSQSNKKKTAAQMDVVTPSVLSHLWKMKATILIHGHTHKPGLSKHLYNGIIHRRYVLSDWDDAPSLLCYYRAKGFEFLQPVL